MLIQMSKKLQTGDIFGKACIDYDSNKKKGYAACILALKAFSDTFKTKLYFSKRFFFGLNNPPLYRFEAYF